MKDSYKRNSINGFVRYDYSSDGQIDKIDSTLVDKGGNIQTIYTFYFSGKQLYKYDTLGRLISLSYTSDTIGDFFISYECHPKNRAVIQKWYEIQRMDTIHIYDIVLYYNASLDTITKMCKTYDKECIESEYIYHENRLISINGPDKTELEYDLYGQLERVYNFNDGKPVRIEFISTNTGLIDSVLIFRNDIGPNFHLDTFLNKGLLDKDKIESIIYFRYF
jgi:hypothetical protein